MTLNTTVYVLDPVDPAEVFRFAQTLLTKYDEAHRPPEQMLWHERDASHYYGDGAMEIYNEMGQGLPAILDVRYRSGRPIVTEGESTECTENCETPDPDSGDDPYHAHPRAAYLKVSLDTAYSYKHIAEGYGCGALHARIVADLGLWLDERGVRWEWENEFSGEVWGGDDRYAHLVDLDRGGKDANAWFTGTVLPAIMAGELRGQSGE